MVTKGRVDVEMDGTGPTIVCLFGSTRFGEQFRMANLRLTVQGQIVLSIGCDTKADADLDFARLAVDGRTDEEIKRDLGELHKRKIDLADYVLVLSDRSGYFGDSTRGEIAYAPGPRQACPVRRRCRPAAMGDRPMTRDREPRRPSTRPTPRSAGAAIW